MTAYGAVISLGNTIDYILHSSHFSLIEPSPHILQLAYEELNPLQEILEKLDRTRTSKSRKSVNALDRRIKDLIWEFEDLLESLLYQQIHSQIRADQVYEEMKKRVLHNINGGERFSVDLHCIEDDARFFIERVKNMEKEYIYEVDNMPEDDDEEESISSTIGTKSKLIGLSDQFQQLKGRLIKSFIMKDYLFMLVGTAGVGKTALAKAVFEDHDISRLFEHRAWVRVGRKSQFDDVSRGILAQMFGITQGDRELGAYMKERLVRKKCLIVLDDVWETQILDSLFISLLDIDYENIYVLVTTRDINSASPSFPIICMLVRLLNEEESKELLCEKVFGEKECPFQLDKAATKIAKKCEGLPLTIVTVADIISKAQNTDPKYWDDVAEMRNSVFTDAYNQITKVLFPSYDYLPQYFKVLFLYMGVFPPDYDIPISKFMNMLATEGWYHNINKEDSLKDSVQRCLNQLCTRKNLVLCG